MSVRLTALTHIMAHPGRGGCAFECVTAETSTAVFGLCYMHLPSRPCHLDQQCVKSKNAAALQGCTSHLKHLWNIILLTVPGAHPCWRPCQLLQLSSITEITQYENVALPNPQTNQHLFCHVLCNSKLTCVSKLKEEFFDSNHCRVTLMLKRNLYLNLPHLCKEMGLIMEKAFSHFSTHLLPITALAFW